MNNQNTFRVGLGNDPAMQMLQQQQLLQNSMNDPMSNLLAQQMAQLQMQQQLTFQQPLAYPSVSFLIFRRYLIFFRQNSFRTYRH